MSQSRSSPSPASGSLIFQKPFSQMTPDEGVIWLKGTIARLRAKQQREKAYLDRRAARGTRTPTDEAYAADQGLETELLLFLDDILRNAKRERQAHP